MCDEKSLLSFHKLVPLYGLSRKEKSCVIIFIDLPCVGILQIPNGVARNKPNISPSVSDDCNTYLITYNLWAFFTKTNRRRHATHHLVDFAVVDASAEQ